ncbi:MAG: RagB/SusD family nutrient uptake outer membrane protein [Bacteroidetes bacterium]|nr:MAG: RagB/SusD family nutrient uptake outer membrane protein [Bacteroidota bacterium]
MKAIRLILPVLFLAISSCNFLDEKPESLITSANYYKTEADAVAATNALYDYLSVGTTYLWDPSFGGIFFNDYWVFKDLLSDNTVENLASTEYRNISEFKMTAENVRIEYYWQDLYNVVNASNIVIAKVPLISMDENKKNHLIAEARFIRAMMYFELVRLFGDAPLLLNPVETLDDAFAIRVDKDIIYQTIFEDLEFAESNLSTTYRVGLGRPTPFAVTALFAKVHLEKGNYQDAVDYANLVISNGPYTLWPNYEDIFKITNMNSGEIIFAVNFSGTLSQGFKPNQYHVRLLPPGLDKNGEGPENAHGWETPSTDLYDSFDPLDQRRAVTFISSFTYMDGTTETFEPHISKFWDQVAEPRGNNTDSDVIYLRYADILLIYAEALNEVNNGPTAEAYDALNQVRKRARFNGNIEQSILPDLSGLTYQSFKDAILEERRWEFVMEGSRYHDLVRHGKLIEKVEGSGKPNATPKTFHNLLPIPQREIDLNKELIQNTGY